jgi:hypothetical protein
LRRGQRGLSSWAEGVRSAGKSCLCRGYGVLGFVGDEGGAGRVFIHCAHHLWGGVEGYCKLAAYFLLTSCREITERCSGTWRERDCGSCWTTLGEGCAVALKNWQCIPRELSFAPTTVLHTLTLHRMWLAREPGAGSRDKESGEQGLS